MRNIPPGRCFPHYWDNADDEEDLEENFQYLILEQKENSTISEETKTYTLFDIFYPQNNSLILITLCKYMTQ